MTSITRTYETFAIAWNLGIREDGYRTAAEAQAFLDRAQTRNRTGTVERSKFTATFDAADADLYPAGIAEETDADVQLWRIHIIICADNGDVRVHRAWCRDIARDLRRDVTRHYEEDAASQYEAAVKAHAESILAGEMTFDSALRRTTFLPCAAALLDRTDPSKALLARRRREAAEKEAAPPGRRREKQIEIAGYTFAFGQRRGDGGFDLFMKVNETDDGPAYLVRCAAHGTTTGVATYGEGLAKGDEAQIPAWCTECALERGDN